MLGATRANSTSHWVSNKHSRELRGTLFSSISAPLPFQPLSMREFVREVPVEIPRMAVHWGSLYIRDGDIDAREVAGMLSKFVFCGARPITSVYAAERH